MVCHKTKRDEVISTSALPPPPPSLPPSLPPHPRVPLSHGRHKIQEMFEGQPLLRGRKGGRKGGIAAAAAGTGQASSQSLDNPADLLLHCGLGEEGGRKGGR